MVTGRWRQNPQAFYDITQMKQRRRQYGSRIASGCWVRGWKCCLQVNNTITQKDKELIYGFGEVPIKIRTPKQDSNITGIATIARKESMVSKLPYWSTYLRVVEKRKKKCQSYTHGWPDRRNGSEKMGLKNYEEKKDQAWGHSNCVDEKNSFGYMVYDLASHTSEKSLEGDGSVKVDERNKRGS
ncbi:hypothetical protein M8C21_009193, partial [Ambrosia artemisiifolia]